MAREALALVVVLKRGDEELKRVRIPAGSGAHVCVGPHAEIEAFRIPVPGVTDFGEVELFKHRQGSRAPEISPWHLLRPRSPEVSVSFDDTACERAWHPAMGFPGDWCTLHAGDAGKVVIGEFVIEFAHDGYTPPAPAPDVTPT